MKGLLGLCCLLASVGLSVQILPEVAGHSFWYELELQTLVGIPELANQFSGLSLLGKLKVDAVSKTKAVLTIENVRVGKLNEELPVSYEDDIEFTHTPSPHYERELSKPVIVHFDEHEVDWLEAQKSDPIWSVNIKKAIVEKFQLDLKRKSSPAFRAGPNQVPRIDPSAPIFSVYEDGIGGECETLYSFQSIKSMDHPHQSEDVLNVTKTKNYRNCRNRVIFRTDNFEDQGCSTPCEPRFSPETKISSPIWREPSSVYESGCHLGFEPDHRPVKNYAIVGYNISGASHNPLIEGIIAKGKVSYNLYGREMLVASEMNITLVKRSALRSEIPKIPHPVKYDSLEYQLPEVQNLSNNLFAILGDFHAGEVVRAFSRMLEDLVNNIIPTEPETSQNAGTNVVQLVNALSVLSKPELEELFQEVETEKFQKVPKKEEIMRKVFLDLLAIAATDEIALFVRDLIVNKRITDWEASEIIQGIGKNADEPSDEVIEAYIEMLDRPRFQQNRVLLADLGIAIGRMIEDSCVEEDDPKAPQLQKKPKQEERPRHPRAIRSSEESEEEPPKPKKPEEDDDECSPQELQDYIQKIGQKLREAKTFNKMLIYIETLAHMGTPEVLPYLKPYVTGEAPNAQALEDEDTDFLATNALYSLHHIAESYPDEVLPIVSSIYFDPSEDYDQRAAAISVLLACDPPLSLLQRIASELHNEINNQVGSYTYSLLSELSNSTLPCDRKMAQKIQLVLPHAPNFDIGLQYANSFKYTLYNDDGDYGVSADHEYIPSNVSWVPRAFRTAFDIIRGPFSDSFLEVGGTVKGVEELLEKLLEPSGILSQMLSRLGSNVQIRNIPQIIDIVKNRLLFESQDYDIPRASLYYKLFGRTTLLTLDEKYIVELLEQAVNFFRQIDTTSGFSFNYVKIWMPDSFIHVVPSVFGFPVVVSERNPVILTWSVNNARVSSNQQKQAPLTSAFALSTNIDFSFHRESISMAYVVDPASDQVHGAVLEKTTEIAMAEEIEIVVDLLKETYALSVKPKLPHEIFYHNTRPSTFIGEAVVIREPKSEWLGQVNEIETIPEPFKFDERSESRLLGMSLRVVGDSESPWADIPLFLTDTAEEDGLFAALVKMLVNPEMINRELHVYLEPHRKNPAAEILLTADYDKHLKLGIPEPQDEPSSTEEDEEYEKAVSSIYGHSHSVPDALSTIEKLVKKTQPTWAPVLGQGYEDPVPATVTHVLDLTMAIKGARIKHHTLRLMYAHSLGFRSNWFQAVAHQSGDERDRPWQLCASLVAAYPEMPNPFYVQMNTLKSQSAKFEGEIGWGTDCQHQNLIKFEGSMEKSEEQLTSSSGMYETEKDQQSLPWYYKECQVHKTEGKTQSSACQTAISEDSQLNVIKLDIIAPHLSPRLLNLTYKLDLMTKYYLYPNLEVDPLASNPEDRVSIELEYSEQVPDIPLLNLKVEKPSETLVFSKLYAPWYEPPSTLDFYEDVFMDQFYDDNYYPECNLMEDYLTTLDNVTIELPDNKCQYILAHDNSPDRAFTIIASQVDFQAKTKALSMVLAHHSIKVLPPRGEVVPIILDGKEFEVTPKKPIVMDFDKETELRIFTHLTSASTETPIVVIHAPYDGIIVKCDGKNALIKIPRGFQGDQVGLCGNFNDEQFQELRGPHGCVYVEEEDFANSYAVPGQSCPKPPQPRGPAFCPAEIEQKRRPKESEESEEKQEPRRHKQPEESEESVETKHIPRRPKHVESKEEPWPVPPRSRTSHHKKPQRESDEDDDEYKKPQGPKECTLVYTPVFEDDEGKTCFGTQPAYKCQPECRTVRPKEHEVPFHCLPPSKYEKLLKEQAKEGLVNQIQNKPVEKTRPVLIPEKCM